MPNLPAGVYRVWPNVPAFIVSDTTGLIPQGKPVVVNEAETVEDINFALVRGAVITGRVTDADGRAVIGEAGAQFPAIRNWSQFLRPSPGRTTRQMIAESIVSTDCRQAVTKVQSVKMRTAPSIQHEAGGPINKPFTRM